MAWTTRLQGSRGGTRYRVEWRDPAGGHRSRTFRRRKDAEYFLHRTEVELASGTYRDPRAARTLLGEHLEAFLAAAVDLRPTTRELYEMAARRYVVPRFGTTPIGSIGPADIRAWMAELASHGTGARTIQLARQVLSRALRQAVVDGMIVENPARAAPPPRAPRRELRIPTTADVEAIAEAIAPRYRAMVLLAAYGGLRFGELAGLRRRDVRLLERKVDVVRQVVEAGPGVHVSELKTAAARRSVTIPSSVADELGRHLEDVALEPDAHVFTGRGGFLLRRRNYRGRVWLPALRAAGVEGVRFHDLRHHAAAAAIAAGGHPKAIQARLGHASITTTLDTYGSLMPSLDTELADRLDEVRAGARPTGQVVALPARRA